MRKRIGRFEPLESRRLLAAHINEILFDPLFGDPDTDQYVELRGEANSVLGDGTFLVVVESEAGFDNSEGTIHGIFDLSGQTFGSNGLLVLLPQNSPFSSHEQANTLVSTAPGFGGLPGGIYEDSHALSDRIDFIYASNTFFLIQTDVTPQLGDDLDTDSDGFVDSVGIIADWTVYDSISTMWGLNDGHAYGAMVFVDTGSFDPQVTVPDNATLVTLDGTGYVGRIGNSTGSAAEDWVAGTVKDMDDDNFTFRLAGDIHGRPAPIVFQGRELDHVGDENFNGAVRAGFFEDLNGNGEIDAEEPVFPGTRVLADTNGNRTRDLITTEIEPDDFVERTVEINNLTPGVSLSTTVEENVIIGFDITAVQEFGQPEGQHIFAHANVGFFNNTRRLRMDFYRPAQEVSIDVIGNSDLSETYGRLEVFNAAGESLEMIRTGPLLADQRQTLSINRSTDDIAYAVAYSDEDFLDSSPFGKLDTIRFSIPEAVAESTAEGLATLNYLVPDFYEIVALPAAGDSYTFDPYPIDVTKYENFDLSFPVRRNFAPEFEPAELSVDEDATGGTVVGQVMATDDDTQIVRYTMVSGGQRFNVNSTTGVVSLRNGVGLDFETATEHEIVIRATDNANVPLSAEETFIVEVNDVNEPPQLFDFEFQVAENSPAGTVIGTIEANDPDGGFNGQLGYRIIGENPAGAIAINGITGELSVNNAFPLDFETRPELAITVEVFDSGNPPLTSSGTVTLEITDENEAPSVSSSEFAIGELSDADALVGTIQVSDPEQTQTHTFSWAEGFSSDIFTLGAETGEIRLAAGGLLDFHTQSEYFVQVQVSDSGLPSLSSERELRIRVIDENNPPEIHDVTLEVAENSSAETLLGTVTVSDPDPGQTHVFAIVGGDGASRFTIDRDSGEVRVAAGAVLDFEDSENWELIIQSWDSGQPTATADRIFSVAVTNVNEPPQLTVGPLEIAENSPAGTIVGQLTATDPDGDEQATLELVPSAASELFSLDTETGNLMLSEGATLNFEDQTEYALQVRVSDGVSPALEEEITVTVFDRNDQPQVISQPEPLSVLAGFSFNHNFAENLVSDEDADQTITWSLRAAEGQLPGWLQFDPATLQISGSPWNPAAGEWPLQLVAIDSGQPPLAVELDFVLTVQQNANPWQNIADPLDANGDGNVRPVDALVIINYLNRNSDDQVDLDRESRPNFLDVNGNNRIEPIDALKIINELNRQSGGEGEASATAGTNHGGALGTWDADEQRKRAWQEINVNGWDSGLLGYLGEQDL
ncbi:cadherin domain-containing protein [Planctomycetaceae bacterium SH139]